MKGTVLMCLDAFRESCRGVPLASLEERVLNFAPDVDVIVRGDPNSRALDHFRAYREMLGWTGRVHVLPADGSMLSAIAQSDKAIAFINGSRVHPYHSQDSVGARALAEKIGHERVVVAPIDQVHTLGDKESLRRFARERGWLDDFPRFAQTTGGEPIVMSDVAYTAAYNLLASGCRSVRVVFDPDSASGEGSARFGAGALGLTPENWEAERQKWRGERLADGTVPYLVEEWLEGGIPISFTWLIDAPFWTFEGYVRQIEKPTPSATLKYAGSLAVEHEQDLAHPEWLEQVGMPRERLHRLVLQAREKFEERYLGYVLSVGWRGALNIDALLLPNCRIVITEINPRHGGSLIARNLLKREIARFKDSKRNSGHACESFFPSGLAPASIFDRALAIAGKRIKGSRRTGECSLALPCLENTSPWAMLAMPTASETTGEFAVCLSAPVDELEGAHAEVVRRLTAHSNGLLARAK